MINIIGCPSYDRIIINNIEYKTIGGAGFYTALSASIFDKDIYLTGYIGTNISKYFLGHFNLNTEHLIKSEKKSPEFVIKYDNDFHADYISAEPGCEKDISISDILPFIKNSDLVHITPLSSVETQLLFTKKIKEKDILISAGTYCRAVKNYPETVKEICGLSDFFFLNINEAKTLFNIKTIEDLLKLNNNDGIIIVTSGSNGAYIVNMTEKNIIFVHSYKDTVIKDTTGAGDSFCGAFISTYIKDKNIYNSAKSASSAASFAVEDTGSERLNNLGLYEIQERKKNIKIDRI